MSDNFCSSCGLSLNPLTGFYVSRDCEDCGKKVYSVKAGEGGKGIQVNKGDSFHISSGTIKLSLKPTKGIGLFRGGIPFLIDILLSSGRPQKVEETSNLFKTYSAFADNLIESDPRFEGINLKSEDECIKAFDEVSKDKQDKTFRAFLLDMYSQQTVKAIAEGDAEAAAFHSHFATTLHTRIHMMGDFEDTLWRGYLANKVVYEAAQALCVTPEEEEAVGILSEKFTEASDEILQSWEHSKKPIGPLIGVTGLPEDRIKSLIKWHIASRQQVKEDRKWERKHFQDWVLRLLPIVTGLAGLIIGFYIND